MPGAGFAYSLDARMQLWQRNEVCKMRFTEWKNKCEVVIYNGVDIRSHYLSFLLLPVDMCLTTYVSLPLYLRIRIHITSKPTQLNSAMYSTFLISVIVFRSYLWRCFKPQTWYFLMESSVAVVVNHNLKSEKQIRKKNSRHEFSLRKCHQCKKWQQRNSKGY